MTDSLYLKSDFKPWNDLVGEIPLGAITAFVGPPEAGKSTLALQLSVESAKKLKGNVLYFDTETNIHAVRALADAFEGVFQVPIHVLKIIPNVRNSGTKDKPKWVVDWTTDEKPLKDALNIFVVNCPDIEPILIMHGRGAEVDVSASGKVMTYLKAGAYVGSIREAPFFKFVVDNNVKAIVYDSITNPYDDIPTSPANLPARSDMTQMWMIQIQKLATILNIPIFATVHESKNDSDPFHPSLKMEGGKGVGYNVKWVVYIMKDKNKALIPMGSPIRDIVPPLPLTGRHLFIMRHGGRKPAWAKFVTVEMTEKGMEAVSGTSNSE